MKLDSLCNVISGQIISRLKNKDFEDDARLKKFRILMPKAISGGKVDHKGLAEEFLVKEPPEDCITKEGDIIFKLSSPYGAAYISKNDEGLVVPSFCCRLTDIQNTEPFFLLAFLNSTTARRQFDMVCGGSTVSILKITSMRNVEVPGIDAIMQKDIGQRYHKVLELKDLVDEAIEFEMIKNDTLFKEAKNAE